MILVATTIAGGSISITTTGGWTWNALTGSPIDVTAGEKLYVWWARRVTGSETAPSVTAGSDHVCAGIAAYSGCRTDISPIDTSATSNEATSDTSFSFATGINTSVANVLCICICSTGTSTTTAQFTTMANTSLTSLAERMDYETTNGGGGGFAQDQGLRAVAGTMGTFTSTLTTASPKAYIAFGLLPPTSQTISSAGAIDSGEAVGTPALVLNIAVSGIATTEAVGGPSLSMTVSPSGIATTEAVGTPIDVAPLISPSGIATTEAVGSPALAMTVSPGGVASGEAVGTPKANLTVSPGGIATTEAAGSPSLSLTIAPSGVATDQAVGTPNAQMVVSPGGVATTEAVGTPNASLTIAPSAVVSDAAVGEPSVALTVSPPGVVGDDAVGDVSFALVVRPEGIDSGEAVGHPQVDQLIYVGEYDGEEGAVGSPVVIAGGTQIVSPFGIESDEGVGSPTVSHRAAVSTKEGGGFLFPFKRDETPIRKKPRRDVIDRLPYPDLVVEPLPKRRISLAPMMGKLRAAAVAVGAMIGRIVEEKEPERIPAMVPVVVPEVPKLQRITQRGAAVQEPAFGTPSLSITVRPVGVGGTDAVGDVMVFRAVTVKEVAAEYVRRLPPPVVEPVLPDPPPRATVKDSQGRGFEKMRKLGIPRVPFNIEDAFAQTLAAQYRGMFRGLVKAIGETAAREGFKVEHEDGGTVLVSDADPRAILHRLMDLMGETGPDVERLRARLNAQMMAAERRFFRDMVADADKRTASLLIQMSLPKRQVFEERIAGLRALYLDQAVDRIAGEQDDLKKRFLQKLVDWVEGKTDRLYVSKLLDEMKETSARRAKFFARDQFSRFNRSLLVATYQQAEAQYVEVLDVGDGRVRPTHREWNRKIYTTEGLTRDPRWLDYACRCGFAPVYGPLTADQRRRFVA